MQKLTSIQPASLHHLPHLLSLIHIVSGIPFARTLSFYKVSCKRRLIPCPQLTSLRSAMENPDWDFVLQFVSEPSEMDMGPVIEKAVAEKTELPAGAALSQVPTPPVRLSYSISCRRYGRPLAPSRNPLPHHLRTRLPTRTRLCLCRPHSSLALSFTPSRPTLYYYHRTQSSSSFT